MVVYEHIKLGADHATLGSISIHKLKDRYPAYNGNRVIQIPDDAYINERYRTLDENQLDQLIKEGKEVYWHNPYNQALNTSTTFMIFYMEEENIIPLFIVAPPDYIFDEYAKNHSDTSMMYTYDRKLKRKLRKRDKAKRRGLLM